MAPILEQLLHHVVAEHVLHELQAVPRGHDFLKHDIAFLNCGNLHLLLDETAAMLVARKLDAVAEDVLELPFACLVILEFRKYGRTYGRVGVPGSRRVTSIHCVWPGVRGVLNGDPTNRAIVLLLSVVVLPAGRKEGRASKGKPRAHNTCAIESWCGGAFSSSTGSGVGAKRGRGHAIARRTVEECGIRSGGSRGAIVRLLLLLTVVVGVWAYWRVWIRVVHKVPRGIVGAEGTVGLHGVVRGGVRVRREHELGRFVANRILGTAHGKAAEGHGRVLNTGIDAARLVRAT